MLLCTKLSIVLYMQYFYYGLACAVASQPPRGRVPLTDGHGPPAGHTPAYRLLLYIAADELRRDQRPTVLRRVRGGDRPPAGHAHAIKPVATPCRFANWDVPLLALEQAQVAIVVPVQRQLPLRRGAGMQGRHGGRHVATRVRRYFGEGALQVVRSEGTVDGVAAVDQYPVLTGVQVAEHADQQRAVDPVTVELLATAMSDPLAGPDGGAEQRVQQAARALAEVVAVVRLSR